MRKTRSDRTEDAAQRSLEPGMHAPSAYISRLVLYHLDEAMRSFAQGQVGDEFDLDEVRDLIEED
jgi:hypothetical protein